LPVAEKALRVLEVKVEECRSVGSHMLFVTSVQNDTQSHRPATSQDAPQLFHAFSSYRQHQR
jgi:hypothetical protein